MLLHVSILIYIYKFCLCVPRHQSCISVETNLTNHSNSLFLNLSSGVNNYNSLGTITIQWALFISWILAFRIVWRFQAWPGDWLDNVTTVLHEPIGNICLWISMQVKIIVCGFICILWFSRLGYPKYRVHCGCSHCSENWGYNIDPEILVNTRDKSRA